MATMTIRIPDDKHERLKLLASARGTSLNKLFEEFSTQAIAEADSYVRFQAMAARGNVRRGLKKLDKLDKHFSKK